jgi:hypothetical protein
MFSGGGGGGVDWAMAISECSRRSLVLKYQKHNKTKTFTQCRRVVVVQFVRAHPFHYCQQRPD